MDYCITCGGGATALRREGPCGRPPRKSPGWREIAPVSRALAAVVGKLPNFFFHTVRAASTSLALNRDPAAASAASDTPFSRNSCRMRAAPNLRLRTVVACSTKRASDNQPRFSRSSSRDSISSGSSAKGRSLACSSCRECSRRARAFSARARRLSGGGAGNLGALLRFP